MDLTPRHAKVVEADPLSECAFCLKYQDDGNITQKSKKVKQNISR
jgi:Pyruvate/2-oxoacid:ferredoxin oxidoreductase delta subunit